MSRISGMSGRNTKNVLVDAIKHNRYEQVLHLITKKPFDINKSIAPYSITYLMLACDIYTTINIEIVKLLLENGADVENVSKNGSTVFMYAARHDDDRLLKLLIAYIPPKIIGLSKKMLTVHSEHTWAINNIGASLMSTRLAKVKELLNKTNNEGDSALHLASQYKSFNCVRLLLQHKSAVDTYNSKLWTPLIYACVYGDIKIVKELIKYGADIEKSDEEGETPVMFACGNRNITIVKELLKLGASTTAVTKYSNTNLFMFACIYGHIDIVKKLLRDTNTKQDLETADDCGNTALMLATRGKHIDVIKLLLKHGANIEARDQNSETATDIALKDGNLEIVELLKNPSRSDSSSSRISRT